MWNMSLRGEEGIDRAHANALQCLGTVKSMREFGASCKTARNDNLRTATVASISRLFIELQSQLSLTLLLGQDVCL
jgi:hypothetical protein